MAVLGIAWAFLKRIPWEVWIVLALALGIALHVRSDRKTEQALADAKSDHALLIADYNRLLSDLADADKAAKAAIKAKQDAEIEAAKRLAQARKDWKKLYDAKPENRAWADAPLPADVERRLRGE